MQAFSYQQIFAPARVTDWRALIAPYLKPDSRLAMTQLLTTAVPFIGLLAGMLIAVQHGHYLALLLIPVCGGLLVRLFMFQHDCGHGSFFGARWANDLLGGVIGVLTLTPYTAWRGEHAVHHASMGNLDRRGIGDVTTLTIPEFLALSKIRQLGYRLYRHPLVLFGLGPFWLFFIANRILPGGPRRNWRAWLSVLGTNAALLAGLAVLSLIFGVPAVLLVWLPVALFGAIAGVWLFYIQHQFPETYWERASAWNFQTAAMQGASFYDLPLPMHWITGNIGYHHIHHLSSKIPNYRLRRCHLDNVSLQAAPRLTFWKSFACARLVLWDFERRRLISFKTSGV
jgi:omega-6 fatty acid desaturase (delta-12 desaturase)